MLSSENAASSGAGTEKMFIFYDIISDVKRAQVSQWERDMSGKKLSQKAKGVICILIAGLGFSLMSVFVRLTGPGVPTFQKAFFRNFIALLLVGVIMVRDRTSPIPEKGNGWDMFFRALFGSIGLVCNFYAIDHMVLADSTILNKLSPFFAILFSIFLLKEKPKHVQIIGILIAFGGSLLIVKPTFANPNLFASMIGLLSGAAAGLAYTYVRRLGMKGENTMRIIFCFSLFACLFCVPSMIAHHSVMTGWEWFCLIMAGTFACVGQFGITKAYLYAPAKEISVYDYSQILFAAVLGFAIFGQIPDWYSVVGYILIVGAGIAMFLYNRRES